jgi:hypothetical protein
MAVVAVNELERKASETTDLRGGLTRIHTITYLVVTDAVATEGELVFADSRVPEIGDFYESPEGIVNLNIRCIERHPQQADESGLTWHVEVKFSSNWVPEAHTVEDPLGRPGIWTTDSEEKQEPYTVDTEGTGLSNSAYEPYDPPATRDAGDSVITLEKNISFDYDEAELIKEFKHTVNDTTFRGHPAGVVKLSRLRIEEVYSGPTDHKKITVVWRVRYGKRVIQHPNYPTAIAAGYKGVWREQSPLDLPEAPIEIGGVEYNWDRSGWDDMRLDAGFSSLVGGTAKPIIRDGGVRPAKPALLDGLGVETTSPVYHRYKTYKRKDFATMGLGI